MQLKQLLITQDPESVAQLKDAWKSWKQSLWLGLVINPKVYQEHPELFASLVEIVDETPLDEYEWHLQQGNQNVILNSIQNIVSLLDQKIKPEAKEMLIKQLEYYAAVQKCAEVLLDYGADWCMSDLDPELHQKDLARDIIYDIKGMATNLFGKVTKAAKQSSSNPTLEQCICFPMLETKVLQFADLPVEVQSKFDSKGWDNHKLILCEDGNLDPILIGLNVNLNGSYVLRSYNTKKSDKDLAKQILYLSARTSFNTLKELLPEQSAENITKLAATFLDQTRCSLNFNPIIFEDPDVLNALTDSNNRRPYRTSKDITKVLCHSKALVNAIINIQTLLAKPELKPEVKSNLEKTLDAYKNDLVPNIKTALQPWLQSCLDNASWEMLDT